MLKPWSRRILQIAGAVALVALVVTVYRSTDWGKGFTPDGAMTLIAGVIAFIAVIIQIASSTKQVQDQIRAQRDAEREERERQKRAVATAILYEIDSFCMIELDHVDKNLASWDAASNNLPSAAGLRTNISDIYKGISALLGSLSAKSVSAVVKFYSMVGAYEGLWRDYQYRLDTLRAPVNPSVNIDLQGVVNEARRLLKDVRDLIPGLRTLGASVINVVAHECRLDELIEKSDAKKN
jgi:hypothetical protein